MFEKLRKVFAGTWNFEDGYLNQNNHSLFTTVPYSPDEEKTTLIGNTLAKFANLAGRLSFNWLPGNKRAPQIYLEVDASELTAFGETVFNVEVVRPDGKKARFALSLAITDEGVVKSTMTKFGKTPEGDSVVSRQGTFVDWETVGKSDD